MLATVVSFKASKVHFSSTSVGFVFTEETCALKKERHGTGNQAGASTSSTEPRGLYQPCLYTKKDDKEDWLGEDDLVLFVKFCSIGKFCSTGGKFRVSATFEVFILIPTGSKSFGQGTDLQGTESNNF